MKVEDWIDISLPIRNGMIHWPDDPPVVIKRISDIADGAEANVSLLSLGTHTGTHMDAPVHFQPGKAGVDTLPVQAVVGKARVIEIHNPVIVTSEELVPHRIRKGERLLLKTRNSSRCWARKAFREDFVYVSQEAAEYLAGRKVMTLGIDYLSISGFHDDGARTHRTLLQAGIWIIEGLDLSGVKPGIYELLCLPLKIQDGDGAPARAFLKRCIRERKRLSQK